MAYKIERRVPIPASETQHAPPLRAKPESGLGESLYKAKRLSTILSEMPCPLNMVLHEWSHEPPAVSRDQPVKLRRS
jgi:hypothetical protein